VAVAASTTITTPPATQRGNLRRARAEGSSALGSEPVVQGLPGPRVVGVAAAPGHGRVAGDGGGRLVAGRAIGEHGVGVVERGALGPRDDPGRVDIRSQLPAGQPNLLAR